MDTKLLIALKAFGMGIGIDMLADFLLDHFERQSALDNARKNRPFLNISCGSTDYGDINADITPQEVHNFVLYKPNEKLPFNDKQFKSVYCAHTLEHVDNPKEFLDELHRVGEIVFLIVPHFWGLWPILNPAHKWLVISSDGYEYVANPFYNPAIPNGESTHWHSFSGMFIK